MELNSLGTIDLFLVFLLKILSFLLCGGVRYTFSNLVRHWTNLEIWALSLLDVLFWVVFDIKPGAGTELGKLKSREVETCIDLSLDAEEIS